MDCVTSVGGKLASGRISGPQSPTAAQKDCQTGSRTPKWAMMPGRSVTFGGGHMLHPNKRKEQLEVASLSQNGIQQAGHPPPSCFKCHAENSCVIFFYIYGRGQVQTKLAVRHDLGKNMKTSENTCTNTASFCLRWWKLSTAWWCDLQISSHNCPRKCSRSMQLHHVSQACYSTTVSWKNGSTSCWATCGKTLPLLCFSHWIKLAFAQKTG